MRLLLLLLLLWQPGRALAHAALLEASPQDGGTYQAAPEEVRLRFDEPVGLIALGLAGPQGAVALARPGVVENDVLSARLPPGLPRGTYLLSWRVTSADSHPVAGSIAFGVGVAPASHGTVTERWLLSSMVVRGVFLAALLVAAGGAMFRLVAEPPGRLVLAGVAWAALGLAGLQVGLRGALLADAPGLLDAGTWWLGGGTTLAASLAVTGAGLLGCAVTLPGQWRRVGAAAGVLAVAGLPLSGHAGTADPRWLMAPALVLHGVAAAYWIGALVPLLGLLRGDGVGALRRFSAWAAPAVAVLLLSGVAMAAVQLGSVAAVTGSAYGQMLLWKLAGVAGLLALAAVNRLVLTPRLAFGGLRRSIAAELVLAGGVLAATGVLGLTPPPRAVPGRSDRAAWTVADGIEATIAVSPARPGRNRITVTIGRAVPPREVTLELRNAAAGVAALRRPMRLAEGEWVYEGPEIALPGRWTLRAEALLTEFDQTGFTTEIDIP